MDPVSLLPAMASLFMAVFTASLIVKRFGAPSGVGRFASIDGLRGYLAFCVFLHHSCIWYFYLKTNQWKVPPSHLYTHFGESSLTLFFMITGFLFFSKLIDGRTRAVDWGRLFVSRFLRLVPLYLFAMFVLLIIVILLSKGNLNEPLPKLIKGIFRWLSFTMLGSPDLNRIERTSLIMAKVTWSLPYEWFFYFSLPFLALLVRAKLPLPYLMLGMAGLLALSIWHPESKYLYPFLGGIATSFLVRSSTFRQFASRSTSSLLVFACILISIASFPSAYRTVPLLLLSLAFSIIAGGNSLFGILNIPVSRKLGEISYSIYLLHGLILYILFTFVIGINEAKYFSPEIHWTFVVCVTPVLILAACLTFRFIEYPAMQRTFALTSWLRSRLTLHPKESVANGSKLS